MRIATIALVLSACGPTSPGTGDAGGTSSCAPGTTEACYSGTSGTAGVGPCHGGTRSCGGTGWRKITGNVVPGEIITLRIAIWDTSDHLLDSIAIIDAFKWSLDVAQPGTVIL